MDKEKLNFVCWLWKPLPDSLKTLTPCPFTYKDVNALYAMLKKHYHKPFQLICVTDNVVGIHKDIKIVPLWDKHRQKGLCFTRLVAFKKGMDIAFGERFVSIDLDCVIVDDITSLFDTKEDFVIWESENPKNKYCGSLYILKSNSRTKIYETFDERKYIPNGKGRFTRGSDQMHIAETCPDEKTWTQEDGIYTFRFIKNAPLPENAKIIFFNGRYHPNQKELYGRNPWISQHYLVDEIKSEIIEPEEETNALNIVCFYWKGKRGTGWDDVKLANKYINNLYKGVCNHLKTKFNFYCFYQKDLKLEKVLPEIKMIPFTSPNWRGRIPKLKVFDKDNNFKGRVILLDLDIIITGELDTLFSYNGPFMTRGSFIGKNNSQGDMIFFEGGTYTHFWEFVKGENDLVKFAKGNERSFYNRYFGKFMKEEIDYIQDKYPGKIFSFKRHIGDKGAIPKNCSIITCHGMPKLHTIKNPNIRKYWK